MSAPRPRFLNAPWRVEESPGELLVVDSREMIVAAFDVSDPSDLPGMLKDEKHKAYGLAALPDIYRDAQAFLEALSDPVKQLDEDALLACADALEASLRKADIPIPPEEEVQSGEALGKGQAPERSK